jgi:alkanesulfonate monooxygenase SsuD/methylene tetrahydromethanopterin reductase-like flavin-dependent oxidoreductase (luciferase family)
MKVGLFDHVAHADRPLHTLYDERLQFFAAADEAGIYCVHLAEHHCSPINMVPVPGVFLGALARATKRMHIGTLVYLLTLTTPLRMIEEIAMLDQLSNGRLEVGVGRGISPYELGYHKIAHADSRDIFIDAYHAVVAGLTAGETFSYAGKHFAYKNVPVWLRPVQQPYPAFWYGSSNATGSAWAGEQGMHFTANGPTSLAKENITTYRKALAKGGGPANPKSEFKGGTAIGALRYVVVGETDAEAERIARPAVTHHLGSLGWLWAKHGHRDYADRLRIPGQASYEDLVGEGVMLAGSPETVTRVIREQAEELGINYLLGYMLFGDMALPGALRSLDLFSREVMPKIRDL